MQTVGRFGFGYPINTFAASAGAASARVGPVGAHTLVIRIATQDQPIRIKLGDVTVVAAATDLLIPAGIVEYLSIKPGQYVAYIRAGGTDGNISISEMSA